MIDEFWRTATAAQTQKPRVPGDMAEKSGKDTQKIVLNPELRKFLLHRKID